MKAFPLLALALIVAGCSKADAAKDSYDDVPPITGLMERQIDRAMLRDIWTYVQDQKAFKSQFDADLKEGKLPHLPRVKP